MGWGIRRRGLRIAAESARRRSAEQALKQAEDLLQHSFAANPEPMLVIDRQGGVVRDANAAFQALLGLSADKLIGRTLDSLGQHVDAAALQQLVLSLDGAGALDAAPLQLRRADGQARDCLVTADALRADDAVHVFCVLRDVTDALAQDAALRAGYDALATQLAQTSREMEAARQGRAQAEGSLQAFTRTVSHDLKTPLNAVLGFSGLLQDRLRQGRLQEAQGFAERIASAARRMDVMINALTSLAQVSRQVLQRRPVDMHRLARDSWDLLVAARPDRLADFRLQHLPEVQADPDLVAQVWQNLLDNACKYSARSAQPRVSVDSYQDTRGRWYRVTDNGAGFDMAHAGALFQPFHRLHASSQFEGTGVGLSLVRRIIDHHGGEIRLRSAPGVGTVAEFTLDPAPPAP
jgi:PAS domain S-box-containing protein